jgi:outer membrane protein assembly factor BamB
VNRFLKIIILILFSASCSLDNKIKFWNDKEPDNIKKTKIEKIFKKEEEIKKEINSNLKINIENLDIRYTTNEYSLTKYKGLLQKRNKSKFPKIKNFENFSAKPSITQKNLFFFDGNGTIIKFDDSLNTIWKKNFYSKSEKKLKPFLSLSSNKEILIVADNISKYYAIKNSTGELLWSKNNSSPFNSRVEIFEDKILIVDFDNTLRCFSIKNGNEIWNFKTEKSFIKSQKNMSLLVSNNILFFNNSIGDISAIDIESGDLIWQTPTQSSAIYENSFLLKTSNFSLSKNAILFSNNKNEFFSINKKNGTINWKLNVNSSLTSIIHDKIIFTISDSGYLILINENTGRIIRATDIFDIFKDKKRKFIKPIGFIANNKNIYLTTSNGKLLIIDLNNGKTKNVIKVDNNKISKPYIMNKKLIIIANNFLLKLD